MKKFLPFLIIFLALFVRVYRIAEFTEFYGDQGMDGLLIMNATYEKTIPLVGPLSSQGLHQGAFYLYLVAPSLLLTNFNPLGPAFFMTLLGSLHVFIFYLLTRKIFSEKIAFLTTLIFALSPIGIFMSRTYWNSFLLPIGTTALLFCFTKLKEDKGYKWFIITGLILGLFVQMHYTGLMLLVLAALFWFVLGLWRYKKYTLLAMVSFAIPFIPFLLFQMQHNFVDIKGLLKYMHPLKEVYRNIAPPNIPTLFGLSFQHLLPQIQPLITGIAGFLIISTPFFLSLGVKPLKRPVRISFWHKMLTLWLCIAIVLVTRNKGDFQLHYLDVLFPIPFLLLASFLQTLEQKKQTTILFVVASIVFIMNIVHLDIFLPSENRLAKSQGLVDAMIEESNNKPFSFTIISPSFSDSHYRFLFKRANVNPLSITDSSYETLFVACEKTDCPKGEQLAKEKSFPVTCYDLHCEIFYPKIDVTTWKLIKEENVNGGLLFEFKRLLPDKKENS